MDALDRVLRSVRMESSVISRARYGEPWSVETRGAPFPIMHAIVEGACVLRPRDGELVHMIAGDIAVLPQGPPHIMASDHRLEPTPIASLTSRFDGIQQIEHGGGGVRCIIVCGTFQLAHEAGKWLLGLLPPVMHMRPADEVTFNFVHGTLRMLDCELGIDGGYNNAVVTRLTDMLVLQTLRASRDDDEIRGWLAALRDERIGKALAAIHAEPGADWTVAKLASSCGMSRSRFFERFSKLVGDPPAKYLARWRASTAADMMRRDDISTAQAAEAVGYSSEKAFTQAFRRHLGMSPSAFRRAGKSRSQHVGT